MAFAANIKNSTLENTFDTNRSISDDSRLIGGSFTGLNDSEYNSMSKNVNQKINKYFLVGDRVRIILDLDLFRQVQEGHGGWQPKMANVTKKICCCFVDSVLRPCF